MFNLLERPSIFQMFLFISQSEEDFSYLDYFIWIGGNFYVFYLSSLRTSFISMLLVSSYYFFYQILLAFVKFQATLDLIFYGEIPYALLTAPLTPLLTRSLGVGSGLTWFTYTFGYSTYLTYFFFNDASLSSYLMAMTFAQNCNCRTKPSPGWMHGLPFFTFSLASSYPKKNVLITYAITKELLLETPAQQWTRTPPFFLPSAIKFTTQSNSSTGNFCCLLS